MPYDIMQVCEKGHMITSVARSHPEAKKKFCPRCGEPTHSSCPECGAEIKGMHTSDVKGAIIMPKTQDIPRHCEQCGAAYSWAKHVSEVK